MQISQLRLFRFCLAIALSFGCAKSTESKVHLVIDADTTVREQTASLRIALAGRSRDADVWEEAPARIFDQTSSEWPRELTFPPKNGDTSREFSVRVVALDAHEDEVVVARAVGRFANRSQELRLLLTADCFGISCDATDTCLNGECVPASGGPLNDAGPTELDGGTDAHVDDADVTCSEGYADCDGNRSNGCEADLETSHDHCGACDTGCGISGCESGRCLLRYQGPEAGTIRIALGRDHSCGLKEDGTVRCWGRGTQGQLGNGAFVNEVSPVEVEGLDDAVQISAGSWHTCAVRTTGTVACWGNASHGALGTGATRPNSPIPLNLAGLGNAVQVSAGGTHTCALTNSGEVWCWGYNEYGQVGSGDTNDSVTPQQVDGLSDAVQVSVGGAHTCALSRDGTAACWGSNPYGQLGIGVTGGIRTTPVLVDGLADAVAISAGNVQTCAIREGGLVVCWGYWPLGRSGAVASPEPSEISDAVQVSSANVISATCARRATGQIACWGSGYYAGFGNGTRAQVDTATTVSGILASPTDFATNWQGCALEADDSMWCWGYNQCGQAGNGESGTCDDTYTYAEDDPWVPTPIEVMGW